MDKNNDTFLLLVEKTEKLIIKRRRGRIAILDSCVAKHLVLMVFSYR